MKTALAALVVVATSNAFAPTPTIPAAFSTKTKSSLESSLFASEQFTDESIEDSGESFSWKGPNAFKEERKKYEYVSYDRNAEYPDEPLDSLMKKCGPGAGIPLPAPQRLLQVATTTIRAIIGAQLGELRVNRQELYRDKAKAWFSPPKTILGLPNPIQLLPANTRLMETFNNDEEICQQYFSGVHPTWIRVCDDPTKQLSQELLNHFQTEGINVRKLASEKRLFYADYEQLFQYKKNPHESFPQVFYDDVDNLPLGLKQQLNYFTPGVIVMEMKENNKEDMDILAISLDTDPTDGILSRDIYTKDNCSPLTWDFAKATIRCSDANMHQFVTHIGKCHFMSEPIVMAMCNAFEGGDHPLWDYFKPMTQDNLIVNKLAQETLANSGPMSSNDFGSAMGTGQFLQMLRDFYATFDFFNDIALPNELAQRGFSRDFDAPTYHYMHDAFKLWDALGDFAKNVADEIYSTDEQVKNDAGLQNFANEMAAPDKAAIKGFPAVIEDKATLIKCMHTLSWMMSGQHAGVNFGQYDYNAFPNGRPFTMRKTVKQFLEEASEDDPDYMYREAYQNLFNNKIDLIAFTLLAMPTQHALDNLSSHYDQAKFGTKSYQKLLVQLDKIGRQIDERNKALEKANKAPYPYLHPSRVPASIDN